MKKFALSVAVCSLLSLATYAQNWLTSGNSGVTNSNFLGTKDNRSLIFKTKNKEYGRLQNDGVWKFGTAAGNATVDSIGILKFNGNGVYTIRNNQYIFNLADSAKAGLFYNYNVPQYEFRNGNGASLFSMNAMNGNALFRGKVGIGAAGSSSLQIAGAGNTSATSSLLIRNTSFYTSLFVRDDGKVGIGTSSPNASLSIFGTGTTSATTPFRIQNVNSYELFTVRDNGNIVMGQPGISALLDIWGDAHLNTNNTTNCEIRMTTLNADMGWFTGGSSNRMGLYNYSDSKTLMTILGTGEAGIGSTPVKDESMLTVTSKDDFTTNLKLINHSSASYNWEFWVNPDDLWLFTEDGPVGRFDNSTGVYISGFPFLQKEPKPLAPVLDGIMKLRPQSFRYSKNQDMSYVLGFIGEDAIKAFPEVISSSKHPRTGETLYGVNYNHLTVLAIKAIQEQQQEISGMKAQNNQLQVIISDLYNKNAELEQRLARLEALINPQLHAPISSQSNIIINNISILEQNVPNPFNRTTTISYTLPQSHASAKIIIADKAGRLLKEINIAGSGKGSLTVDASTLTAGAYSYSLYVNGKLIDTKQMALIK